MESSWSRPEVHNPNAYCDIVMILISIDMILMHTESMAGLRKELKRLPISKVHPHTTHPHTLTPLISHLILTPQPKVLRPPLLPGESLLMGQGVHCYLLSDGRDNNRLTPADGQVFLTSYRVVFLGTPCDVQGMLYPLPIR